MSFLSSLFGKKDNSNQNQTLVTTPDSKRETVTAPTLHFKGKPDANGLYPSELVMLALANRFKTTETIFPQYLTYTYEIANPPKMLKSLESRGFITVGSAKDTLQNCTLPELKEITTSLGITAKGKKADIIAQLLEVDEVQLDKLIKERIWNPTESGNAALRANPYIQYFLEKHPYNVNEVGVNIWTVNEDFVKNPTRLYRDIIFRQLNDQMNRASIAVQKNPMSGSANTYQYCECYRMMGLFIEEEGKSFVNAADYYFQYLFKRINIHAGLQLMISLKLFPNDRQHQATAIHRYYDDIQLYPFHKTELLRLIDELGIEGDALRESMIVSFKRANDIGIMTEQQAADFTILELSGEADRSRDLAEKLAKESIKRIR